VLVVKVVVDVSELVLERNQLLLGGLDALLDGNVVFRIHVPGAGMAHHFAVARLVSIDRSRKVCGSAGMPRETKKSLSWPPRPGPGWWRR